jgi:hypothetical protein
MSLLTSLDSYTASSIWKVVFHEVLKELCPTARVLTDEDRNGYQATIMCWGDGPLRQNCEQRYSEHGDDFDELDKWFWSDLIIQKPHRLHGPAIRGDDRMIWCVNGRLHRERDRPAIITAGGDSQWWVNGRQHRGGSQPAVLHSDGSAEWWFQGVRHRGGGLPAVVYSNREHHYAEGRKQNYLHWSYETWTQGLCGQGVCDAHVFEWWVNGQRHRNVAEGPAVLEHDADGRVMVEEYWVNGQRVEEPN